MFSVPEGRAANQPLVETTFSPPIGASFPGARVSFAVIGSPASSVAVTASGESFLSRFFCSGVAAASMGYRMAFPIRRSFPGSACQGFSCTSRDFRCKQAEDDAVLVGAPHRAIVPQEAGARAFLAAEAGSLPKAMMSNRSFRLTRLAMGFGEQRNRKPD